VTGFGDGFLSLVDSRPLRIARRANSISDARPDAIDRKGFYPETYTLPVSITLGEIVARVTAYFR
jgi:hypothetical protein